MGKLKEIWRSVRKPKALSTTTESDRPIADTPPSNRQARSENPPGPLRETDPVSHDGPDDNPDGGPDATSSSHGPSNAVQIPSPCPTTPDPRASSASETANAQAQQARPQMEDEQASSRVVIASLWSEAADSLDTRDQEELHRLITSRRERPSVDDVNLVLDGAKQLQAKDKTWSPVLNKIVKGVLAFKSLGDAAVKFDKSGYAALGWSVVSFGLQVADNAEKERGFVFSSSEAVTEYLARYAEYEQFRGPEAGEGFDHRVRKVYKAILLYVMALHDYLQRCEAGRIARGIYEVEDCSIFKKKEAIDKADIEVGKWLPILHIKLLRRSPVAAQSLPEPPQPSQEWLRSLAFLEMDSRQKDIDTAAEGTCEWLLRHDVYRNWVTCDRGLLWIKGKPGSGKSTLLRYALDNVLVASTIRRHALVLSFFFHGRGSELQKTPLGLFRSFLHQLLCLVPTASPELIATFDQRCHTLGKPGEKWEWHLSELQDFFQSSLHKVLQNRPVWLFIDALDESGRDNAVKVVKELKSLLQRLQTDGSPLHICFSCRHYPLLDRDFKFEICLEHENRNDISTYVRTELSTSGVLAASTIPNLITNRAEGVFMWARLVVDRVLKHELEGAELPALENEVNSMPRKLNRLYQGLVRSMHNRPASLKLIQWICFATRPLSLDELRWAMTLDANTAHLSLQQCRDAKDYISDKKKMETKIKVLSCGLAEVVESANTPVVQFIHESVKDFFVKRGLSTLDGSLKIVRAKSGTAETEDETDEAETETESAETEIEVGSIGNAHYQLSRTCIRYLAMNEISQSTTSDENILTSEFPLLHYATTSWVTHVQGSEARDISQDDLLDYFAWPTDNLMRLWVRVYRIVERYSDDCPPEQTLLIHVASRYQLLGPLQLILAKMDQAKSDIDKRDDDGRTPLSYAAANGREAMAIVQFLLEKGAAVDTADKYGRTPLSYAAENGHKTVVQVLLEKGAAVDIADKYGRTPLSYAAESGYEAVVQILLEKGAAVDMADNDGRIPLSYAAGSGYEAVVQFLLERGAAVDTADNIGWTPLSYAAANGREAVVQVLLEKSAAVDMTDNVGRIPLSYAAGSGYEAVVQFLLERGAAVDTADNIGWTPLLYAAANGREAVVQFLLEKGAAVDTADNDGRTPLSYAAANGHKAVIQFLLEKGAAVDTVDKYGRTPLSFAARSGYEAVVRLLRSHVDV